MTHTTCTAHHRKLKKKLRQIEELEDKVRGLMLSEINDDQRAKLASKTEVQEALRHAESQRA